MTESSVLKNSFDDVQLQSKTQNLSSYQIKIIDNTPAWMNTRNIPSKRARMFTLNGTRLNVGSAPNIRSIPLALDNGLPGAVLRFGIYSENETPFTCHLDSYAAMNTGSLHLHQWIIKIPTSC